MRSMHAQRLPERGLVQQVDLEQLDPFAHAGEVLVLLVETRNHPDHLVVVPEQQLGEVRAVLAADAGDQCSQCLHWCKPRTYIQASLKPSERSA